MHPHPEGTIKRNPDIAKWGQNHPGCYLEELSKETKKSQHGERDGPKKLNSGHLFGGMVGLETGDQRSQVDWLFVKSLSVL